MASYAQAAGPPKLAARKYWINKEELAKAKKLAKNDGKVAYMSLPKEIVDREEKREIVYHTQSVATGRIENMEVDVIEECLGPLLKKAKMIQRGKSFGTVVVTFENEEEANLHAGNILKTERIVMAPSYGGRKTVRIRIGRIPIKINVEWVVACLFGDMEIEIIEIGTTPALNWWGFGIEIYVNATEEQIENIPYRIFVQGEKSLNVIVYGRPPICYFCLQSGHFRAFCPRREEERVESQPEVSKQMETEMVRKEEEVVVESEEESESVETNDSEEFVPPKRRRKEKRNGKKQQNKTEKIEENIKKVREEINEKEEKEETEEETEDSDMDLKDWYYNEEGFKVTLRKKLKRFRKENKQNEWLVFGVRKGYEGIGVTKGMLKRQEIIHINVKDDEYIAVRIMTRKVCEQYGLRINLMSDLLVILEEGQIVTRNIKLHEICEMEGDIRDRFRKIAFNNL